MNDRTDYTEQEQMLAAAKEAYKDKTDDQLKSAHLILGLVGGEREAFFEWVACSELLKERGYTFYERYALWTKDA